MERHVSIIAVLAGVTLLMSITLALMVKENHKLQREIEGYSDQVMELERMLEGR